MKITLRLIVSLLTSATLAAAIFSYLQVRSEQERLTKELERQATILGESLQESVRELVRIDSPTRLKRIVERFGDQELLIGVAVYNSQGLLLGFAPESSGETSELGITIEFAESILILETVNEAISGNKTLTKFESIAGQSIYLYAIPLKKGEQVVGSLALIYNASEIEWQNIANTQQYLKEQNRLARELERQARLLSEGMRAPVKELFWSDAPAKLRHIVERFGNRERLIGVAVYDNQGVTLASTPGLLSQIQQLTPQFTQSNAVTESVTESIREHKGISKFEYVEGKEAHFYAIPLSREGATMGALVLFHDASYINRRLQEIWLNNFFSLLTLCLLITLTSVVVVRWSITGPIAQVAEWLHEMRTGNLDQPALPLTRGDILGPLTVEVADLARELAQARKMAEEAQVRVKADSLWTAERLKDHIGIELGARKLFVVSNREPYMHEKQGQKIECIVPAGGLVTALDPILRACGGMWVAHGSGSADRETADRQGRLMVPPDEPLYTLKRVWITKEEEEGYYYGFSNEGLWPLCHITHTRPVFRLEDWMSYQKVNEKFANALLEELKSEEKPLVLIQDYQLALVPLLVKAQRPDAKVAIFWHIPWPNAEVFGICPWKEELLLGLLGADLIGFHTQFHCNNFLETVDRVLECKIHWDQFSIERNGRSTSVQPFPISVAFPDDSNEGTDMSQSDNPLGGILKELGLKTNFLGVGVDRIDYTKGIVERFQAIERLLEKYPEFIGHFTFVELGAPSRTHIKRYHDLIAEIETIVDQINWRFQTEEWKPIVFLKAHHSHETINRYYKVASLCMVTSLHDGMNLVAKEYIAARDDEDGVLILSQFTGAAQELPDALIVNPYDIEEMAEAIRNGLIMSATERSKRMRRMREVIKERNVYRWAANLVITLSKLRVSKYAKVGA